VLGLLVAETGDVTTAVVVEGGVVVAISGKYKNILRYY